MKELIGKRINNISVSEGEEYICFDTDHGQIVYQTYGDCCSETWFADITGVSALLGGVVTSVDMVDMDSVDDGRGRQEFDSFYGVKILTNKGYADIVYRNSSNGYYG